MSGGRQWSGGWGLAYQWRGGEDVLHALLDSEWLRGETVCEGMKTEVGHAEEEAREHEGHEEQGDDSGARAWTWMGLISRVRQSLAGPLIGLTLFVGIHYAGRESWVGYGVSTKNMERMEIAISLGPRRQEAESQKTPDGHTSREHTSRQRMLSTVDVVIELDKRPTVPTGTCCTYGRYRLHM